ncbi:hypothetical protein GH714_018184 [Hevea brasiliensis]|uniref:NB-ARC domain-containing protein n=1 Tax=Hevea brasiliensis TaxID=3981 RepID=A0A6A6N347_HEVBR|nr:hypothetical protein GH714_018184 [Hevea brasiliensis]
MQRRSSCNPLVKMWLDKLKDLAYDVEDILDEYQTESLQSQVEGETEAGSNEDCWKLFLDHAFDGGSVADPKVEVIREKVINKCGGLPLAARTLGGLLRSKPQEHWEDVMNSEIWNSQGDGNNILSLLRLSYYHLPSHLKRCFAYCAILPKDYAFEKKQLVLLWMAEGLIEQQDDQHMEDVGEEYFQDLFSRSLFQSSSTGGFVMHDLVNDLAQVVAGDTYFRLEEKSSKQEKARHSSYIPCRFDRCERFEPFETMKHMRTFLPLSLAGDMNICLANCIPSYLFSKLRFLRVLSFNHYKITKLPDSIGDLKHLSDAAGNGKIEKSSELSNFVVGEGNEVGITALVNLKFLRGALRISRLDNVANASNVRGTILLDKGRIDDLEMAWGSSYLASRSVSVPNEDRVVLEKMKPHESLEKLTIIDYGGLGYHRVSNVKAVDCEFCGESMSSSNPFPALETLRFEDMKEWKEWNICGCEFRLLRELSIVNCPELLGNYPAICLHCKRLRLENAMDWWFHFKTFLSYLTSKSKDAERLTSLENLSVAGGCPGVVSFPQDEGCSILLVADFGLRLRI